MSDETIIMLDSAEAAQSRTVTGWYDRGGQYFGNDEHTARWSGCTHVACGECGAVTPKNQIKCDGCYEKERIAHFNQFPVEKWDGETPLVLFDTERYFFAEDILDFIADSDPAADSELRICKCEPRYLTQISGDNWSDDLPEDGELPDAVQAAVDALNVAIKAADPVSWWEVSIKIDVADLRARVSSHGATHMSMHD